MPPTHCRDTKISKRKSLPFRICSLPDEKDTCRDYYSNWEVYQRSVRKVQCRQGSEVGERSKV